MGTCKHRHIVKAVSHHGDTPTQGLQGLNTVEFFLGLALRNEVTFAHVQALGDGLNSGDFVARHQKNFQALCLQSLYRF